MITGEPDDEGGEAPCFAHLLDQLVTIDDALLATLVRNLADAVVIADADGTIAFWNEAAERLFGWSMREAVGQSLDLIIPERQRARHWTGYRQTMATGETKYGEQLLEVPALHRDGHRLSIAFTVSLIRRAGERLPIAIAAVIRDESARWHERKRLQEELTALRASSNP
jgi:PAS domain S-box-containing protein